MMEIEQPTPSDIRIDRDGVWYFRGAEMFRKEFVFFFYEHLRRDDKGRYLIELENERCFIDVEDTAFVVNAVYRKATNGEHPDEIELLLSDGTIETLQVETLRIGKGEIPYCMVKDLTFEARFSKAAYYQLADFVEYDEERDAFYIDLQRQRTYIHRNPSIAEEEGTMAC